MSEQIAVIVDLETNEITERPLTQDEVKFREQITINNELKKQEIATQEVAKQALLDRLGITQEEAKLLLA
jgi:DNA-nicking Smr family endonuclease